MDREDVGVTPDEGAGRLVAQLKAARGQLHRNRPDEALGLVEQVRRALA